MNKSLEEVLTGEMFVEQVAYGEDGLMVTYSRKSDQKPDSFSIVNVTAFIPFSGPNSKFREQAFIDTQHKLQWCVSDGEEELMSGDTAPEDDDEAPW